METNNFKTLRLDKGFTLEKLSEVLDINKSSLSKKERGLLPFSVKEIKTLKKVFKLNPKQIDEIFFG